MSKEGCGQQTEVCARSCSRQLAFLTQDRHFVRDVVFGPYIVFRNRFLYGFMFVYIYINYIYMYVCIYISVKMAAPWGSLNLLSYYSLCPHLRSH